MYIRAQRHMYMCAAAMAKPASTKTITMVT
jgi:hypothetical protein